MLKLDNIANVTFLRTDLQGSLI